MIEYDDFVNVDIRVGKILEVQDFHEARKPAYKLLIDFGPEIGRKRSSAQIVKHYTKEELRGKLVMAVVNFPAKRIGPFLSEVLTLGVPDEHGDVVLLTPTRDVPLGGKMFEQESYSRSFSGRFSHLKGLRAACGEEPHTLSRWSSVFCRSSFCCRFTRVQRTPPCPE